MRWARGTTHGDGEKTRLEPGARTQRTDTFAAGLSRGGGPCGAPLRGEAHCPWDLTEGRVEHVVTPGFALRADESDRGI